MSAKQLKSILIQKVYHFEKASVVTSRFLLSFPPTILHIDTVRVIWWFLGSLLYYYFDKPASNIEFLFSENKKVIYMENS